MFLFVAQSIYFTPVLAYFTWYKALLLNCAVDATAAQQKGARTGLTAGGVLYNIRAAVRQYVRMPVGRRCALLLRLQAVPTCQLRIGHREAQREAYPVHLRAIFGS